MNSNEIERRKKRLVSLIRMLRENSNGADLGHVADTIDGLEDTEVVEFVNVLRKWLV